MRTPILLALAVVMLVFATGTTCTHHLSFLEVPLDGYYGGVTSTGALSLDGVRATVAATDIGYEICLPARQYVQFDWVDNNVVAESRHKREVRAWASGRGTFDQGQPAVLGCVSAHEIHWMWTHQRQDAEGDVGNDKEHAGHACLILYGAAQGEDFYPVVNGCGSWG